MREEWRGERGVVRREGGWWEGTEVRERRVVICVEEGKRIGERGVLRSGEEGGVVRILED